MRGGDGGDRLGAVGRRLDPALLQGDDPGQQGLRRLVGLRQARRSRCVTRHRRQRGQTLFHRRSVWRQVGLRGFQRRFRDRGGQRRRGRGSLGPGLRQAERGLELRHRRCHQPVNQRAEPSGGERADAAGQQGDHRHGRGNDVQGTPDTAAQRHRSFGNDGRHHAPWSRLVTGRKLPSACNTVRNTWLDPWLWPGVKCTAKPSRSNGPPSI